MALDQLATPTVKPPTSLDLMDQEGGQEGQTMQASASAAPLSTTPRQLTPDQINQLPGRMNAMAAPQQAGGTVGGLAPPTMANGLPAPNVSQFAAQQMANPSRYGIPIVQQGINLINQEMDESAKRGTADLDEFYSSRGLVGSSVESQGRGDFLSQLERTKSQRLFDLTREMANTYASDITAAGQLGLGAQSQEILQSQFGQGLAFDRERLAAELGISREQLDLQRDQMSAEYGDRQAERLHQMNLQQGTQQFAAAQASLDRMLEQQALDLQRQGLDAETAWREADRMIEQRALDLQQQGMAADEAYRQMVANQQTQLSAADIYLRALAAGAGDYGTVNYPNIDLFGGGTTGPGGASGTGGGVASGNLNNIWDWYNSLPLPGSGGGL